jgi:hypothetical protein
VKPGHDVYLVAVATGPGIDGWYWRTAKPYQPDSPRFEAQVVGASGAVWLDADRDGRATPAYDYARRLVDQANGELPALFKALADFDEAVAAQAANLAQHDGADLESDAVRRELLKASDATQAGFQDYLRARRANESASAGR